MKRIIPIIVMLSAMHMALSAQSLVLSDSTGPLAPFANLTVITSPGVSDISVPLDCTNTSSDTISVKVKKIELQIVSGSSNAFCWVQCYPPFTFVSPDALEMPPAYTSSLFTGDYFPTGLTGTTSVAYVFFDENNPDDSVMVTINYDSQNVGITELLASGRLGVSNAYPNPASNTVAFDVTIPSEIKSGKLILRNILGSVVIENELRNNSGKILLNVADLSEGVYFYSFLLDDETAITKKLIIKR